MSITLNIRGTIITFPSSGAAPNYAEAIVEFAQAVEESLNLAVGAYDVAPQTMDIDSFGAGATNESVTGLSFDTSRVKSASITISTYRNTVSPNATFTQTNNITIDYNATNSSTNKWNITQERVGDSGITFAITDTGQVTFSADSKSGTHSGFLSYSAKATENE